MIVNNIRQGVAGRVMTGLTQEKKYFLGPFTDQPAGNLSIAVPLEGFYERNDQNILVSFQVGGFIITTSEATAATSAAWTLRYDKIDKEQFETPINGLNRGFASNNDIFMPLNELAIKTPLSGGQLPSDVSINLTGVGGAGTFTISEIILTARGYQVS